MFICLCDVSLIKHPSPISTLVLWNPLGACPQLIRNGGWIAGYSSPNVSAAYLSGVTLLLLTLP